MCVYKRVNTNEKNNLKGMRIAWEPERMRHFSAKFEPM